MHNIERAEEKKQRLCKNEVIVIDEDSDHGNIKQAIEKNSAPLECSRDTFEESSKTKQSSVLESPFSILSNAFQICTKTKGRIEITNTLTNAFLMVIKNNPAELFPAICLASDTLPTHRSEVDGSEENQLGVGGSSISKALQESLGCKRQKLRECYKKFGDLGDAAEYIASSKGRQALFSKPKALSIMDVYTTLIKISKQEGQGVRRKREAMMLSLFRRCDASTSATYRWGCKDDKQQSKDRGSSTQMSTTSAPELKFLTRCLLRNMRINASMITIMNSCARACELYHNQQSYDLLDGAHTSEIRNRKIDKDVRQTYAIHHDLQAVVLALKDGGISEMRKRCQVKISVPIDPMLAKPATSSIDILSSVPVDGNIDAKGNILCEWKYDGMRAQIHIECNSDISREKFHIFSRHCADVTARFYEVKDIVLGSVKKTSATKSFILDCEIVAYDKVHNKILPFQKLSTRKKKVVHGSGNVPNVIVAVVAFDILYLNSEPLLDTTLRRRRELLFERFESTGLFHFAKSVTLKSDDKDAAEKMSSALKISVSDGCEGLMVKLLQPAETAALDSASIPKHPKLKMAMLSAKYQAGKRSDEWRKLKADYMQGGTLCDSLDLVVVGAWNGTGRKHKWYSPFLLAVYDEAAEEFQSLVRVMSGFSDEMYAKLKEQLKPGEVNAKPDDVNTKENCPYWFDPEYRQVWEIRGAELSISPIHQAAIGLHNGNDADEKGLALRFPRFIRIRNDKRVHEATSALQIAEIFENQVKKM